MEPAPQKDRVRAHRGQAIDTHSISSEVREGEKLQFCSIVLVYLWCLNLLLSDDMSFEAVPKKMAKLKKKQEENESNASTLIKSCT